MTIASADVSPRSTVQRAFSILQALSEGPSIMRLTQLAARVGLPKATVHRFVAELLKIGALQQIDGGGYALGPLISALGVEVPLYSKVRDTALPYLQDLYHRTNSKVVLGTLQGPHICTLAKIADFRSLSSRAFVGRVPAHCTAVGKAILATGDAAWLQIVLEHQLQRYTPHTIVDAKRYMRELAVSRDRGYAVNDQESRLGTYAVAVPLRSASGRPIAALAIASRLPADERRMARLCDETARRLERELLAKCPGIEMENIISAGDLHADTGDHPEGARTGVLRGA